MGLRQRWREWRSDREQDRRMHRLAREAAITTIEASKELVEDMLAERDRLKAETGRLQAELEARRKQIEEKEKELKEWEDHARRSEASPDS